MAREMKDSGIAWIGQIPKDWEVIRQKNIFSLGKELVGDEWNSTQLLSLTTQGIKCVSVGSTSGKVPDSYSTYQKVQPNNLVMCLFDLDCSAVFSGLSKVNGMISPAYKVLSISENDHPDFYRYWFDYIFDGRKFMFLSKNIRYSLTYDEFASLGIVQPSLQEQQLIANFLDEKCGEIDELVALQEKMIEELKAYKQSVITETVTKGLDPNVKMKDSGVEWIGEIPEHWGSPSVSQIAYVSSGTTPNRNNSSYWFNGNINWIKTGELQNCNLYDSEEKITQVALDETSLKICPIDTILMAMYGQGKTRGMTALLKTPSTTNQACASISVYNKKVLTPFLWKSLMGAYDAIREKAQGTGQPNLNLELISKFRIALPPFAEQKEIVSYLDEITPKIDSLISIKQKKIDELKDYKKSLIYEYVTGKKQVI